MEASPRIVVILGAGASHAIDSRMPLTDELGGLALGSLPPEEQPMYRDRIGYFEALMSRLAEDQPDLSEAENLRNRSRFRQLADAVATAIAGRQAEVLAEPMPAWLVDLCWVWHENRATIVTFNYDSLVERAAASTGLHDWDAKTNVAADDVIDRLPPFAPGPSRWGPGPMPATMRLLKLHGSVAWFAAPDDPSGATLARQTITGWYPDQDVGADEIRREFPGRQPFIIPPTSAKSRFYSNPVVRQLWRDAGAALEKADEVHLVGYSMPATDLVTRGMLRPGWRRRDLDDRQPQRRTVVDRPRRFRGDALRVVQRPGGVLESTARRAGRTRPSELARHRWFDRR
ncbi:MAG: hypothetical protein WBA45_14790 [Microthrixaceae bacterium]